MNKVFYLCTAAFLSLASCSGDKVEEVAQGKVIKLRASVGLPSRATEINLTNLGDLTVNAFQTNHPPFGAQLIKDAIFSKKDGTSNIWESRNATYYWPFDEFAGMRIWAYNTDALNASASIEANEVKIKISNLTPEPKIKDQKDLVVGTWSNYYYQEIPLNLKHVYSQIEIKALSRNEVYDILVRGVKICNVDGSGEYSYDRSGQGGFEVPLSLNQSDKVSYEVTDYDGGVLLSSTPQSLMGTEGNAMLIPQQLTAWDATSDKTNTGGNTYIAAHVSIVSYPVESSPFILYEGWAAIGIGTKWEAGKKYTYTLDFTNGAGYVVPDDSKYPGEPIMGKPLNFTVTVSDWENGDKNLPL